MIELSIKSVIAQIEQHIAECNERIAYNQEMYHAASTIEQQIKMGCDLNHEIMFRRGLEAALKHLGAAPAPSADE